MEATRSNLLLSLVPPYIDGQLQAEMADDADDMGPFETALAKSSATSLSKGVDAFMLKVVGPALEEVGAYFGDRFKLWRAGRGIYTVERAAQMLKEAGLKPHPMKMKHLISIMEGASLEDEDDLTEMWAALLANAASGPSLRESASFVAILRQLDVVDAGILRALKSLSVLNLSWTLGERPGPSRESQTISRVWRRQKAGEPWGPWAFFERKDDPDQKALAGFAAVDVQVAVDNLFRLGLLWDQTQASVATGTQRTRFEKAFGRNQKLPKNLTWGDLELPLEETHVATTSREQVTLSALGLAFMTACEPPMSAS